MYLPSIKIIFVEQLYNKSALFYKEMTWIKAWTPLLKRRDICLLVLEQKGQKPMKQVWFFFKVCFDDFLKYVLNLRECFKEPQLKEGRMIYIKGLELTNRCCCDNKFCRNIRVGI